MAYPATKISHAVFDVDGVFTTGQFIYTEGGKFAKIFGPHDADGIKLLQPLLKVSAISADKRGWNITKKRIELDMGIPLTLVPERERVDYFKTKLEADRCVYMADGWHDIPIFNLVAYSIAPANAWPATREAADYVTALPSGQGAGLEACLHISQVLLGLKYEN